MSLYEMLSRHRVVICAGPGGVGKTTTSAAVATGMAMRGLKVAVVTIDPARRLADALGLDALDDEPRRVDPERFPGMKGELHALMLDSKRTFDNLIERVAPDEKARDEVFANRIYQELSSAVAGSQEFTAMAKIYELDKTGGFDLLVLDTPPSRNALDFLDAPDRLTGFLQGRAVRMFLRPAGIGGKLFGAGTGVVFAALKKATGVGLLDDLSTFFRALGGMIPELAERGSHVKALLGSPETTFLLVTSLEREPVDETVFFYERLRELGLPFGAAVVNKVRPPVASVEPVGLSGGLAGRVRESAAEAALLGERDAAGLERLTDALDAPTVFAVPQLPGDVADLDGLAHVVEELFEA